MATNLYSNAIPNAAGGRSIGRSLREYGRGIGGGLLFSLPLLYTNELWQAGQIIAPGMLIGYVIVAFLLLIGYNRFAGLRRDANWQEVVIDSVEELGLGLLLAAGMLLLLGRITGDMSPYEMIGKIVIEAMTVAIGISVGTAQLDDQDESDDRGLGEQEQEQPASGPESNYFEQLVIALCGAVLFASNVAPTEEIRDIAIALDPWRTLGLVVLSLALGAMILYFSEFRGTEQFVQVDTIFSIASGVVMTYTIALLVSALALWFFGRFDSASVLMCLNQTIVLGVAATLGASAGRLLLQ